MIDAYGDRSDNKKIESSVLRPVPSDKSLNIDILRGFAALLVAFLHCREVGWIGIQAYHRQFHFAFDLNALLAYLSFPVVWGSVGVPIFFVLSGYCIHKSQAAKLKYDSEFKINSRQFLLRRFIRIYPVLIGALVLTFIADRIASVYAPGNYKLGDDSFHLMLVNLVALQGIFGRPYGSNGALWTLSLEIQFYLLYPLLFCFRKKIGPHWIFVPLLIINIISYYVFERRGIIIFTSYWVSWYFGAYVAEVENSILIKAWLRKISVIAVLIILLSCFIFFKNQYFAFQLWAFGFSALLFFLLKLKAWHGFIPTVLEKIGIFSYSLYIVHLPIAVMLTSIFFGGRNQENITWALLILGVAIIVGYVFHLCFERPAMIWLSRKKSTLPRTALT